MEVTKIEVPESLPVLSSVFLDPAGRYLMGVKPDGGVVTVAELMTVSPTVRRGRKPGTIGQRKAKKAAKADGAPVVGIVAE